VLRDCAEYWLAKESEGQWLFDCSAPVGGMLDRWFSMAWSLSFLRRVKIATKGTGDWISMLERERNAVYL